MVVWNFLVIGHGDNVWWTTTNSSEGVRERQGEEEDELRGYPGDDKRRRLGEAPMALLLRRRCVG